MAITALDALSGLRILIAMAKADGTIDDDERVALYAALEGIELPEHMTADSLLAEPVDLDHVLESVQGRAARDELYVSAYGVAYADGHCTAEEQALLDHIKRVWAIPDEQTAAVASLFTETQDTVVRGDALKYLIRELFPPHS